MIVFFFNDTATTEIYTLSLHDALPIWVLDGFAGLAAGQSRQAQSVLRAGLPRGDRKSTRLNSSHVEISYAVFCLKKKNLSLCARMVGCSMPLRFWLYMLLVLTLAGCGH